MADTRPVSVGRAFWLAQVEATTALVREQKARRLEERSRELATEARHEWVSSGASIRNARDKPVRQAPAGSDWHLVRAMGKRELFRRLETCGTESRKVRLTCRGCGESSAIPIGCGASLFCEACRVRKGEKFRVDFQRKRVGVTSAAARAGLTGRFRRRALGGRFGERLVTLTVPHEGGTRARLRLLQRAWERFWRLLSDELRPSLASLASGIRSHDAETGEVGVHRIKQGGKKARERGGLSGDELSLWDLVSYLRVREWTPGADGLGHPHMHVWVFSPYVPVPTVQRFWARALGDAMGREVATVSGRAVVLDPDGSGIALGHGFVPVVDVRAAGVGVEHELVKYLTKEWEIEDSGVRRARPEVFAEVYAEIDGQRQRQSSAGLASWAVKKISICPCCGHEAGFGRHWARVELEFVGLVESERNALRLRGPPGETERMTPGIAKATISEREAELRREWEAERDAEWSSSAELYLLRKRFGIAAAPVRETLPVQCSLELQP